MARQGHRGRRHNNRVADRGKRADSEDSRPHNKHSNGDTEMTQELNKTIDNGETEVQIATIGDVVGSASDGSPVD